MFHDIAELQYDKSVSTLVNILEKLKAEGYVVAELTKAYNIHYHGYVRFYTRCKYPDKAFVDSLRCYKMFGFTKIEQAINEEKIKTYMKKDLVKTEQVLNRDPVIFNYKKTDITSYIKIEEDKEEVSDVETDEEKEITIKVKKTKPFRRGKGVIDESEITLD